MDPAAGDRELRDFVRAVIAARRAYVALRRGTVRILGAADAGLAYLREADGRMAAVALNAGATPVSFGAVLPEGVSLRPLALPGLAAGTWVDGVVTLPPQGAIVLVED